MPDVRTQIAGYMDRVVERVDVEDITAQVMVRPAPAGGGLPVRTKWTWALAGAGAVFAVIGAVAVLGWLVRPGLRVFASGGGGSVAGTPAFGWILAVGGAAGGAALAAGAYVMSTALRARSRRREGAEMQTLERTQAETARRPSRWPLFGLIALIVIGLGFGTWWLVDEYTGVDHEIDVLLDEYETAWNTGDGQAALAVMTSGAPHVSSGYPNGISGGELATIIATIHDVYDFAVTPTGSPTIVEASFGYVVMQPAEITGNDTAPELGFNYFRIVRIDGVLKISRHEWIS